MDIKFHCDAEWYFRRGFEVSAFSIKEYSIAMHNHEFYEVNIVLGGTGIHCIENTRLSVKRGDVFVIPPMVAHAYDESDHLEVYHILLKKEFIAANREEATRIKGYLQLIEIEPFLRSNWQKGYFLHLSHAQMAQLEDQLIYLEYTPYDWEECYAMKYHATWKLLYWFSLLLHQQLNTLGEKTENKYEVQIMRVLEYMHRNYDKKIMVPDLYRDLYMSRSTFLRSFQTICGCTPIDYLNRYRCKKAQDLLGKAEHSKTEIAHQCGFYDLSHMERMLKKYH